MFTLKNGLLKKLQSYENIILYGTGYYSERLFKKISSLGLKEKILSFAVTELNENYFIDNIPVIQIDKLDCNKETSLVVVATSRKYEEEINKILYRLGYKNVVCLFDHIGKTNGKIFDKISFEDCCSYITDWCFNNCVDYRNMLEYSKEDKTYYLNTSRVTQNENLIVLICGYLHPRTIKLLSALKKRGFELIVLGYHEIYNPLMYEGFLKLNIKMLFCECVEQMLYYALQYNPLVYYFQPSCADCSWVKAMLFHKEYIGKVVVALLDIANDAYLDKDLKVYEDERYTLENADGIVWRYFSKDYLAEKKGFTYHGKSILFFDYCYGNRKKNFDIKGNERYVRLCCVASIGDYLFNVCDKQGYRCDASIYEILDVIGGREDCCFHLYAGSLKRENYEICKQLEVKYNNFKLFYDTDHETLGERISEYDYGANLDKDGNIMPSDVSVNGYSGHALQNGSCNYFFDFLDAGLPIITTSLPKFVEYLNQYHVVVEMTVDDLDINYLIENKKKYKTNVLNAIEHLSIDNHISDLIDFFKEVSGLQ